MNTRPLVYRINVAMAHLGVSRTTVYRLVHAGELTLVKVGARASGVTADSVHALISKNQSAPALPHAASR